MKKYGTVFNTVSPGTELSGVLVRKQGWLKQDTTLSEHRHGHTHSHAPTNFNKAFAIGIALNIAFVAVEAFYSRHAFLARAGHCGEFQ